MGQRERLCQSSLTAREVIKSHYSNYYCPWRERGGRKCFRGEHARERWIEGLFEKDVNVEGDEGGINERERGNGR